MKTLTIILVIAAVFTVYAVFLREWLKSKSWAHGFFSIVEPFEIYLWRKSETILFARLKMVIGVLLFLSVQIGAIDLTPLWPVIPDGWEPYIKAFIPMTPLVITALGAIDEWLRRNTTKPLSLVSIREEDVPPEIRKAIFEAEHAKLEAVEKVVEAKAAGEIQK